ncbi:hypothetical protein AYO38_00505 [bacterium SCGC AG-212-C10]|nr:hypothetical protein AYO38_00505 [bacterium SCGC AG-212-C10]
MTQVQRSSPQLVILAMAVALIAAVVAIAGSGSQHVSANNPTLAVTPDATTHAPGEFVTFTVDVTNPDPGDVVPGAQLTLVLNPASYVALIFSSLTNPDSHWSCSTPTPGTTGSINCTHTAAWPQGESKQLSVDAWIPANTASDANVRLAGTLTCTNGSSYSFGGSGLVENCGATANGDVDVTAPEASLPVDKFANGECSPTLVASGSVSPSTSGCCAPGISVASISCCGDKRVVAGTVHVATDDDGCGVVPGTEQTYTIFVYNQGPSDAHDVVVTDTLPAGSKAIAINAPAGWTCSAVPAVSKVTCTIPTLPGPGFSGYGETVVIFVTIITNPSGVQGQTFVNTASSASPDDQVVHVASAGVVFLRPEADLVVHKAVASLPGAKLRYRIRVRNYGPSTAVNLTVTDNLAAQYTLATAVTSPAGWPVCAQPALGASGQIKCMKPSLLPGVSGIYTFDVNMLVAPDGRPKNKVTVSSVTFDTKLIDNTATEAATLP